MNRFTVCEKWEDPWFRRLTPNQKVMFFYLAERCDWGGFLEVDEELIAFTTGIPLDDVMPCIDALSASVLYRDGFVWLKNWIKHQQRGRISPSNRAHQAVIHATHQQSQRFPEAMIALENSITNANSETLQRPLEDPNRNQPRVPVMYSNVFSTDILSGTEVGTNTEPSSKRPRKEKSDPLFSEFWSVYPNRKSRGHAEKAWGKINPDRTLADAIITAVRNQIHERELLERHRKFVPPWKYPATWLNGQCWTDEIKSESDIRNSGGNTGPDYPDL